MELALIAVTLLVIYLWWDRARHPNKTCRRCKGSGRSRSRLFSLAFGPCRRCGGKGQLRR